jgi:putative ABC transport system permease protein
MIKNFIKISWRNLMRHKTYSGINIFGLSVGLAVCMFIMAYVVHEMTFDNFHKDQDRIFWVQGMFKGEGDTVYSKMMSFATAQVLKVNNADIQDFVRTGALFGSIKIRTNEAGAKQIPENKLLFADSNFFTFFTFPLRYGSAESALKDRYSIVLSEKTAKKYFGSRNPIGEFLVLNNKQRFRVSAIARDEPSNSSINFDFVASISALADLDSQRIKYESARLQGGSFMTYLRMTNPESIVNLNNVLRKYKQEDNNGVQAYRAIPLSYTHLNPTITGGNDAKYLKIFSVIAAMTLLLAISNYVRPVFY